MENVSLALEDATIRYIGTSAQRADALHRISIDFAPGQWTALVGRNGSGKSTLAKAIAGVSPLTSGRRSAPSGSIARIVMQHPETQLLGETVEEELALCSGNAAEEPNREQWRRILASLGFTAGLEATVNPLSGGQKQLLNIAGCLVAGASAIVFDEAASMLDPSSRLAVLEAAESLRLAGKTVIWATHRMEEAVRADRIVALDDGRIAFDGTPERFFYDTPTAPSDTLGFDPPYVVQVVRTLMHRGVDLPGRPLTPEALAKAVGTQ